VAAHQKLIDVFIDATFPEPINHDEQNGGTKNDPIG
jgi:hypothetical protein